MNEDIYVLNSSFTRIDLIEGVHSFIWTIRHSSYGDFVLKVPITKYPYSSLKVGNYLENPLSNRLMIIEDVYRDRDQDSGDDLVVVSGRSMEAFLEERVVTPNTTDDYWTLTGNVGWIATELVRRICVDATELTTNDRINNLIILEQDASTTSRTVKLKPTNLYTAVKDLCEEDGLGFRIFFNRDLKRFEFRVYRGFDRSHTQSTNQKVIFSNSLENLVNTSFLRSNRGYKNVAYVTSGSLTRTVQSGSGTFLNWNRRVMYVDASDIKDPTNAKLDNRGRLALAQQKMTNLLDGEVENTRTFVYQRDYEIGDIVSLEGEDGGMTRALITEFITSFDKSDGIRRFPTFTNIT